MKYPSFFSSLLAQCRPGLAALATLLVLGTALPGRAQAPAWEAALAADQILSGTSFVRGTAVNAAGDVFLTGLMQGQVAFGATVLTSAGGGDVFIAKWNTTAGNWAWAVSGGGAATDFGQAITVSGSSVYVTGAFNNNLANANSVQFGGATLNGVASGGANTDAFALKYTDNGSSATYNWAVNAVGSDTGDAGQGITVSGTGVFITGYYTNNASTSFSGNLPSGYATTNGQDAFVTKYQDNGNSATYKWAVAGGGTATDQGNAVAVSGTNVYVTGYFVNTTTNGTNAKFGGVALNGTTTTTNQTDMFVAKFTDGGSSVTGNWAVAGGGTGTEQGTGIAVNGTGVYVTGYFFNNTTNANAAVFGGTVLNGVATSTSQDLFLAKYTDAGSSATYNWATAGGGTGLDAGLALAVSGTGVYVSGYFTNSTTNANAVVFGGTTLNGVSASASQDALVVKYTDATTSATYNWATAGGGSGADAAAGIAVNSSRVEAGFYTGAAPARFGTFGPFGGNTIGREALDPATGTVQSAFAARAGGTSQIRATATNTAGDVFVTGYFAGQAVFGTTSLLSTGGNDVFVAKWNTAAGTWAWAVNGGGLGADQGSGIAVSGTSVYVTGVVANNAANGNSVAFGGTALPGASTAASNDVFVAKYTDNGSSATFGWVEADGGTGADQGLGIAASGTSVYVTGAFTNNTANGSTVVFGSGTTLNGASGSSTVDVFVAKYTDNGSSNTLSWATAGGGTGTEQGQSIAVSGTGVYVTGYFTNDTGNSRAVVFGGTTLNGASSVASQDMFVVKYTDAGSSATYSWGAAGGGFSSDQGLGVAVDGTSVFVTGYLTNSSGDANSVVFGGATLNGVSGTASQDMFLVKYTDATTSATYRWAEADGGNGADQGTDVGLNGANLFVTGFFTNDNANTNAVQFGGATLNGVSTTNGADIFLTKYVDAGSSASYKWATAAGGAGTDQATGLAVNGPEVVAAGFVAAPASFGSFPISGSVTPLGAAGILYDRVLLASITPNSGPVGTSVTLMGSNLTGATAVTFSGTSNNTITTGLTVSGTGSSQTITVTVPTGAATGNVTVTTPLGTSNGVTYTVTTLATVTTATPGSITNTSATLGGNVTSDGAATVTERGVVYSTTATTPTTANTKVPIGSATGAFSQAVTGLSASTLYYVRAYAINNVGTSYGAVQQFTTNAPVPTLASLSPTSGPVGTTVNITGTGFTAGSTVSFNGVAATVTYNSPTSITVTVPTGATTGSVTVTTPGSGTGSGTSNGVTYTVTTPPTVSSLSPTSGPVGTTVNITGSGYTSGSTVSFNGVAATVTYNSPTSISVTVPTGATTGNVTVTTPGQGTSNGTNYTVTTPPTVTSLSPTSGAVGSTVTLTGTGYTAGSTVSFNGVAATVTYNSPTSISVTVPTGATTGNVTVTTPGQGTSSGTNYTVTTPPASPTITNVGPTSGPAGTTVTVTGTNFTGTTGVTLNGTAITGYTVVSPTQITFTVPSGATSGPITVTTPGGTATSSGNYTVTTPPTVSSLSPTSGPVGTTVNITGSGYTSGSTVSFNGVAATVTYNSPTSISVTVPSGATTGNVTVTTPGQGTSSGTNYTVTTPPTVSSLSPTSGVVGSTVNITGTGFTSGSTVSFNGVAATVTYNSPTSITVTVPTGATTGNVTVTTPGQGTSSGTNYTVTTPPATPTITNVGPTSGTTGTTVTVMGTNFTGTTGVTLNGTAVTGYTVVNATTITFTVPSGATSGPIAVTTPGGTATSTGNYTVTTPPTVTSLSPTSGPVGTTVNITGTGYTAGSTVSFNGVAATVTYNSPTSISVTVPAGATTGNVTVTTPGQGTSTGTNYTVTTPPTVSSLSPTSGAVGSTVNITGSGYTAGSTVSFNGVAATVTYNSPTSISVTVPSGATTGNVTVTTPGQGTSNGVNYTVTTPPATPTITNVGPSSGPVGTTVTVTGTNFTGTTGITLNGVAVTGYTVVNPTTITFNVPSGATNGPVTVTTPGGTATSTGSFTVTTGAPDLTVSSPQTIPSGTYNSITVTGTGTGTVGGPVTVTTALVVQAGGTLDTNCQAITGAGTFTLASGAILRICDTAGITPTGTSAGAVQVSGTRSFSTDASYEYVGTVAQATGTGLPAAVRSLRSTNANTVTLTAPVSVAQELSLNAGNLALNGQALTLLSSASGTALVINNGAGAVTGGSATMQRYLTTTNTGLGYRHYSSPVSGNSLADLATGTFTPVFNSAYNTSLTPGLVSPFPTVEGYDQSRLSLAITSYGDFDKGFYSPATGAGNTPDAMTAGQGYAVNLRGTELVDFTGTLHTGNYPLTLARGPQADAGWQLVGNPYPAPLDWARLVAENALTNLDASMYVFESSAQYSGSYRSYVNGIGSSLIGSSQGFFVRVSSGQTTGGITFHNSQRLTSFADQVAVRRGTADTRPQLRLTVSGAGHTDELALYAEAGATSGRDVRYDAAKLANPSGLNLATLTAAGEQLAIDGRPTLATATSIPLFVGVPAIGAYTLTAASLANLAGTRAELLDNLTGTRTLLAPGVAYAFTMSAYTAPGRFWLNLAPAGSLATTAAALTAGQVLLYPNPASSGREVSVTLPVPAGSGSVTTTLFNSLGQAVATASLPVQAGQATGTLPTAGLAAGVYTLRLQVAGTTLTKRVLVN